FAALFALVWFLVRFAGTRSALDAAGAGLAALGASLTRYEGWFLIPFAGVVVLWHGGPRRWRTAPLFLILACLGPVYWLAHNWWCFGDALEFYRGPYSPMAIYAREEGLFPGRGDWMVSGLYLGKAVTWAAGWPLVVLASAGVAACALRRNAWAPLLLLAAPPLFYWWSMHSGGAKIYLPDLPPNSWYNTRYGLAALPLLALSAAALPGMAPRWRRAAAAAVIAVACSAWIAYPRMESWITWKESEVNSVARRAWMKEGAGYLRANYSGGGIVTSFGDLAGVFRLAGIPLGETLHEGNEPYWQGAMARPELMLHEEWAVAMTGDAVSRAMRRSRPRYALVRRIAIPGARAVEIWRRGG
ncbi:MAG: hypothetical protein ACRD44_18965, partial [Bryobacteraceae bacterium]